MRFVAASAVFLFLVHGAWAQKAELPSAPSAGTETSQQNRAASSFPEAGSQVSGSHRFWYWEIDDSIQPPFATYRYLKGGMTATDADFSPASLSWNFTGKHRLVPVLDLTVIQVNPSDGFSLRQKDKNPFGTFVSNRGHYWDKATQSMIDALRR
jgi:hypothetical protein